MATKSRVDRARAKARIQEALQLLKDLRLPREQHNPRSDLTLLGLLGLTPGDPWNEAKAVRLGITEMMNFFAKFYDVKYKPNTRETVRRFTVHQFLQAGLVTQNPDNPRRPTTSPKNFYEVPEHVLEAVRSYGTSRWKERSAELLARAGALNDEYENERTMLRIPVTVAPGKIIRLSPGGQNVLVKKIIEEFCSRFTPGASVFYVGDTENKLTYLDDKQLAELGVRMEEHGKMPDVIVYHRRKNWLVLIEAVTSHGPVNPKRKRELRKLFESSTVGIVYVTAFLDRQTLKKYLRDIAWETEVWVAESPSHLIHFNGERFLGPHE